MKRSSQINEALARRKSVRRFRSAGRKLTRRSAAHSLQPVSHAAPFERECRWRLLEPGAGEQRTRVVEMIFCGKGHSRCAELVSSFVDELKREQEFSLIHEIVEAPNLIRTWTGGHLVQLQPRPSTLS